MSMQRDEQQIGILSENMLRSIPMMYIPIEHRNLLNIVLGPEILHSYGHIIVNTEAIDDVPRTTMMPGRSHHCEGVLPFPTDYVVKALYDSTNCEVRGCVGVLVEVGVEDHYVAALTVFRPEVVHVVGVLLGVDELD